MLEMFRKFIHSITSILQYSNYIIHIYFILPNVLFANVYISLILIVHCFNQFKIYKN